MMSKKRVVIIGLDGVPFGMIKDLSDKGVMPNFKKLREDGVFEKMESSIPEISSVAWSSIITGKGPEEHEIFGFTDLIPNTYSLSFPDFRQLKSKPFWHIDSDKKYVILNVPATYPVQPLSGFIVSGFVSLDLEKSVYPPQYVEKLKNIDYKIDVDAEKWYKSKPLFLKDLFETLEARNKTVDMLWEEIDWDVFMVVFTGTDRIEHFLWDAYENENHEYHKEFLDYFRKIDEAIGNITNRLDEDDELIMLSDHGMCGIKYDVNINGLLVKHGFLKLGEEPNRRYNNIKKGTEAFALDPARIYINKIGKYPQGSVKSYDETGVIERLVDLFGGLEKDGKLVIKKMYSYYLDGSPDLVLIPNNGFSLRGNMDKKEVFTKSNFTGMHTQDDAFLFVKNKSNKLFIPKNPNVSDIVKIMSKLQKK